MAASASEPLGNDVGRAHEPVTLHVYDLGDKFTTANKVMKSVGTGVYHGAVEVYGYEWSFGATEEEETGVFPCHPKENDCFVYRQSVDMGHTELSQKEVDQLIDELEVQWPGQSYHLLQRNCCDFSNEFCKRLGVGPVPGWVKSAAGVGALIEDVVTMKHLKEVMARGRAIRRGGSKERGGEPGAAGSSSALTKVGKGIANLGLGVTQVVSSAAAGVLAEGREARGAEADSGYSFGDFSRGVASGAAKGLQGVLAEGRAARDGEEGDGYRFGDITRGAISCFAKK